MKLLQKIFMPDSTADYLSGIDRFLLKLAKEFPHKSRSQKQEIRKFDRIFRLRDHPQAETKAVIWEGF